MFANISLQEESSSDSQAQSINLDDLEGDITGNSNVIWNNDNGPPETTPVSTPPASITDPQDSEIQRPWWLWLILTVEIVFVILNFAWTCLYNIARMRQAEAGIYEPDQPTVTIVIGVAHFLEAAMSLVMFFILCIPYDKPLIIFLRVHLVFCYILSATFALVVLGSIVFTRDRDIEDMWQQNLLNIINIILRFPIIISVRDFLKQFDQAMSSQVPHELKRLSDQQAPQIPLLFAEESQVHDGTMETSV